MPVLERPGAWRIVLPLAAGAAYSLGLAATAPFSSAADVMTAIPIVVLGALVAACWPLRPRPRPERDPGHPHPYRAWAVLLVAVVACELGEYFARGSRGAHPTLSSMADAVDRYFLLKALVVFGWLCLGALIVQKGTASRAGPGHDPGAGDP